MCRDLYLLVSEIDTDGLIPTFAKVGYSSTIKARFQDIQSCCPLGLRIAGLYREGDRPLEASKLEAQFKKHFKKFRVRGEWYLFDSSMIDWFLRIKNG